jgi:hypothetical protein
MRPVAQFHVRAKDPQHVGESGALSAALAVVI